MIKAVENIVDKLVKRHNEYVEIYHRVTDKDTKMNYNERAAEIERILDDIGFDYAIADDGVIKMVWKEGNHA